MQGGVCVVGGGFKEGSEKVKGRAYRAAVKQHQLGDTNVDPHAETLVVEHVVDLRERGRLLNTTCVTSGGGMERHHNQLYVF